MSQEIIGRFMLLQAAAFECKKCLDSALKYKALSQSKEKMDEYQTWQLAFNEFCRKKSGTEQLVEKADWREEFLETHPLSFPTWIESNDTYAHLVMLATVFLAQMYHSGWGDEGKALGNKKPEIEQLREDMLDEIYTVEEKAEYLELQQLVMERRDKIIGHADAQHFNIKHEEMFRSHNGYRAILNGLDIERWAYLADKLAWGMFEYSKKLQA